MAQLNLSAAMFGSGTFGSGTSGNPAVPPPTRVTTTSAHTCLDAATVTGVAAEPALTASVPAEGVTTTTTLVNN